MPSPWVGDDEPPHAFYSSVLGTDGDVELGTSSPVVDFQIGGNTYFARFADGTIRGWGTRGALGLGNEDWVGLYETPADYYATYGGPIPVGGTVIDMAVGAAHTCALLVGGEVRCFGGMDAMFSYADFYDDSECVLNQGGDPSLCIVGDEPGEVPAPPVELGSQGDSIFAGYGHTCITTPGGATRCWGNCAVWNCGYGTPGDQYGSIGGSADPVDFYATLPGGGDLDLGPGTVVEQDGGVNFHCARFADGTVRCWGWNQSWALGYGNNDAVGGNATAGTTWAGLPSGGAIDLGGASAAQLAVGDRHVCVLTTTDSVRCWGRNNEGQLGYGHTQNVGDDETPGQHYAGLPGGGDVPLGGPVVHVAAGGSNTCAVLGTGEILCWGAGRHGVLGTGTCAATSPPYTQCDIGDQPGEMPPAPVALCE
jgi:hypothetical protein